MRNNYLGIISFLSLAALLASGCSTTQGMAKMEEESTAAAMTASADEAPGVEAVGVETVGEEMVSEEGVSTDTGTATSDTPAEATMAADTPADTPVEPTTAAESAPAAENSTAAVTPDAVPTASTPSASDTQVAAKLLPLPPEDVINTIEKLTKHPRVLYVSSKAQYNYYVGGMFNAEYNPAKQLFTISNDAHQGADLSCQYGKDGALLNQAKLDPTTVGQCGQLVNTLSTFLSN